jgi:uncharacterized protein (DUF1810 family)
MTLFALCVDDTSIFQDALDKYFGGEGDPITAARIAGGEPREPG